MRLEDSGESQNHHVLGFDEFMEQALYHPKTGYYSSGKARIGTRNGGDFFTNVSVGSIYGEILAAEILATWQCLGKPALFHIFEQGANDGQLMADILAALQKKEHIFPSIRVVIIEPCPQLQTLQQEKLAPWAAIVDWISSPDPCSVEFGFFLANELLDAFPFALAEFTDGSWQERAVQFSEHGQPAWNLRKPADWLQKRLCQMPLPQHAPFLIEIFRDLPAWARNTNRLMNRGIMLLCDYGFWEDELFSKPRPEGTYQCYHAHKRDSNPFENIGSKDITAHVNFSEVQRHLHDAGWKTLGLLDQHHYLVGAATPWLKNVERDGLNTERQIKLRQLQTLLHPETMGTQFKFLLAGKNLPPDFTLPGMNHLRH